MVDFGFSVFNFDMAKMNDECNYSKIFLLKGNVEVLFELIQFDH